MELVINGHQRDFAALPTTSTVSDLVEALGLKEDRVAIEQNGEIVARPQWKTTTIAAGDRLEIVHFVGGGAFSSRFSSKLSSRTATARVEIFLQ